MLKTFLQEKCKIQEKLRQNKKQLFQAIKMLDTHKFHEREIPPGLIYLVVCPYILHVSK